jgi:nitrogen fixation protein FixH
VKGDRLWPLALVAVLALTVGANVVIYWVANRGEGPAVERDYYRRAVAWDSTLAEQARSRALGWRVAAALSPPAEGHGTLDLVVADAQGAPVSGARVHVEGFAVAHSGLRLDAPLNEVGTGRYAVRLAVTRTEWHEFRLTVERDTVRFAARLRCLPGEACRVT